MALNRSSEFKVLIVEIVCAVEIPSESAWVLSNITSGNTCHTKFHASEASGFQHFSVYLFRSTPGLLFVFSSDGHFVQQSGTGLAILVEIFLVLALAAIFFIGEDRL